jgi:hypothetical protein
VHTVIREYSGKGAKELGEVLVKHKADVEKLMRGVKGFIGYTLVHTGNSTVSVTTCKDKAGTDESIKVARDWIAKNAANTGVGAPRVHEGSVILHLK